MPQPAYEGFLHSAHSILRHMVRLLRRARSSEPTTRKKGSPELAKNPSGVDSALTIVLLLPRREFMAGIVSGLLAASCRSKGDAAPAEEAIGPLLPPAALAARVDDIKSGKIAVLYVGPDALFGRGHVPGARKVSALDSDEGRRALSDALAKISAET